MLNNIDFHQQDYSERAINKMSNAGGAAGGWFSLLTMINDKRKDLLVASYYCTRRSEYRIIVLLVFISKQIGW